MKLPYIEAEHCTSQTDGPFPAWLLVIFINIALQYGREPLSTYNLLLWQILDWMDLGLIQQGSSEVEN